MYLLFIYVFSMLLNVCDGLLSEIRIVKRSYETCEKFESRRTRVSQFDGLQSRH